MVVTPREQKDEKLIRTLISTLMQKVSCDPWIRQDGVNRASRHPHFAKPRFIKHISITGLANVHEPSIGVLC